MKALDLLRKKVRVDVVISWGKKSAQHSALPGDQKTSKEGQGSEETGIIKNPTLTSLSVWTERNLPFLNRLHPLLSSSVSDLPKAGIWVDPQEFEATWSLVIFLTTLSSGAAGFAFFFFYLRNVAGAAIFGLSLGMAGLASGIGIPMYYVSSRKSGRKREFERVLPFVVERFASFAEAGAPLKETIYSFTEKRIYGIWTEEVKEIRRQIDTMGIPPSDALVNAAKRIPSPSFSQFVSSYALATKTSSDLLSLLADQREKVMRERNETVSKFLDNLGALSESVVSMFVILPITILILGMVAAVLGGGIFGMNPTVMIIMINFVLMPMFFVLSLESVIAITPSMRT